MENYLSLAVSFVGLIITVIIHGVYSQNFVARYKKYKDSKSEAIINSYNGKISKLFKDTKDSTMVEMELTKMLRELENENDPIKNFQSLDLSIKSSLFLFGVSLLSELLFFGYNGLIIENLTLQNISYITLIFGVLCFLGMIITLFSLNKSISEYELEA